MSTPVGHSIVGIALARRLGVRSPAGLAAAIALSNLPDFDIPVSVALKGDPMALHRRATHSLRFAVLAGGLAGALGLVRTADDGATRDRLADAVAGALIVSSHVLLDRAPYRSIRIGPRLLGMRLTNWALDAAMCTAIARALSRGDARDSSSFSVGNTTSRNQIINP